MLDRYILAKLAEFVDHLTGRARRAERRRRLRRDPRIPRGAVQLVHPALPGSLLGRGIRGSLAAFDTLYTVLETTTRALAPLLPLTAEEIWRGLTGGRSVHLTDWPRRRPA